MITSRGQRKLSRFLEQLGFYVDQEVAVGEYSIDCYIEELHCGFELDSKYTHISRKRDKARDKWIYENYSIPICRIDESELKDTDALTKKVLDFIEKWSQNVKERRRSFIPVSRGEI